MTSSSEDPQNTRTGIDGDGVFWVRLTTSSVAVGRHVDHAGTPGSDGKSFVLV